MLVIPRISEVLRQCPTRGFENFKIDGLESDRDICVCMDFERTDSHTKGMSPWHHNTVWIDSIL